MTNYKGEVYGLLGGSLPWSFGLNMQSSNTEATVSSTFNGAVDTLFTTATNGLENFMSADVTVTETTVATLTASMKYQTKTTASLSITGTDANASLPWNIAEVVTLRTAYAQKSGHGRMFLPPFAEDQIASHVIKSATMTSMKTVFDAFFTTLEDGGITPFIFNRLTLKDGTPPFTIKTFTNYDLSNKPAQQRRRVSKVVPARTIGGL